MSDSLNPHDPTTDDPAAAWAAIAHSAQIPPPGPWRTWLFQGGRGAGKTRAGAEWLAGQIEAAPSGRFALVGATLHDVREVMIHGPSGLRWLPNREPPRYEPTRRRLLYANGAVAYAFSAAEPQRLRGPQFHAAWADEFCAWPRAEDTLALLRMGVRLGDEPRIAITTTPRPIGALRTLRAEAACVVTQAGTPANAHNLAPAFLENLQALYGGTRRATQEIDGLLVEDREASLWRAADLARVRGAKPPAFDEIVVAVDPPAGDSGAACGIVVAGRVDKTGFVLADRSAQGLSPLAWARRAGTAASDFAADLIVAEANQGGDMVRTTLQAAGVSCPIRLVHATRSKRARAEPISALYEQGRIVHCAPLPQLEEQMMAFGEDGAGLKDRVDALVWALHWLLVEHSGAAPRLVRL